MFSYLSDIYTNLSTFVHRIDPLSAFRKSRPVSAGTGGTFFALGNICKVPLQNFLYGLGPAIVTGSIGIINFGYHLLDHYRSSDPASAAITLQKNETAASTRLILDKLHSDNEKSRDFLNYYLISDDHIAKLNAADHISAEDLEQIFNQLYNNTITFDYTKYTAATLYAILNAACHVMEFMLLQVYRDFTMFDYPSGPTAGNVILSLMLAMAVYNGLQTFFEVKQAYEHPAASQLCDTIIRLFDAHRVSAPQSNTSDALSTQTLRRESV